MYAIKPGTEVLKEVNNFIIHVHKKKQHANYEKNIFLDMKQISLQCIPKL